MQPLTDAQRKVVEENTGLVYSTLLMWGPKPCTKETYEDLVQEGMLGLMRASQKFDPDKGFRFSTYATWWIRQAVTRSMGNFNEVIRLPEYQKEFLHKVIRVRATLGYDLGREPTLAEIATTLGSTENRIIDLLNMAAEMISLNALVQVDNVDTLVEVGDTIPDPQGVSTFLREQETLAADMDAVNEMFCHLSEREQEMLRMRYGLDTGGGMSLKSIGQSYSVSRERVRQINNNSLAKLRRKLKNYQPEHR